MVLLVDFMKKNAGTGGGGLAVSFMEGVMGDMVVDRRRIHLGGMEV